MTIMNSLSLGFFLGGWCFFFSYQVKRLWLNDQNWQPVGPAGGAPVRRAPPGRPCCWSRLWDWAGTAVGSCRRRASTTGNRSRTSWHKWNSPGRTPCRRDTWTWSLAPGRNSKKKTNKQTNKHLSKFESRFITEIRGPAVRDVFVCVCVCVERSPITSNQSPGNDFVTLISHTVNLICQPDPPRMKPSVHPVSRW